MTKKAETKPTVLSPDQLAGVKGGARAQVIIWGVQEPDPEQDPDPNSDLKPERVQ